MKKFLFLMAIFAFISVPTVGSANIKFTIIKPSAKKIHKLYTTDINPKNFERFIVFVNPFSKRVYKYKGRITEQIFKWAFKYELDPLTLLAILARETRYSYWKTGASKEVGIAQINPSVWFDSENKFNLFKANIILKGKEKRLIWIGKNIQAAAHILNINRSMCFEWHDANRLKGKGYKSINECMIRRYNGSSGTYKYYIGVTSFVGKYYYFVRSR